MGRIRKTWRKICNMDVSIFLKCRDIIDNIKSQEIYNKQVFVVRVKENKSCGKKNETW